MKKITLDPRKLTTSCFYCKKQMPPGTANDYKTDICIIELCDECYDKRLKKDAGDK